MNKDKKQFLMLLSGVFMLLSAGCRQSVDMPPVIVSKAACLLSSQNNVFELAGVSFRCYNADTRQIATLEVSFLVFTDESGGNPLYGSNVVTASVDAPLAPGETGVFEVSLDQRLALIPTKPFYIDCFFVKKAVFADGSEWSDPLGTYYWGSPL